MKRYTRQDPFALRTRPSSPFRPTGSRKSWKLVQRRNETRSVIRNPQFATRNRVKRIDQQGLQHYDSTRTQFLWYLLLWVAKLHFVLKNRWQILQYAVEGRDSSCFDVMCRRRACCVVNVIPHLSQNDPGECKLHAGVLACDSINLFLLITNTITEQDSCFVFFFLFCLILFLPRLMYLVRDNVLSGPFKKLLYDRSHLRKTVSH